MLPIKIENHMNASDINTQENGSLRERFREYLAQHGKSFESISKTKIMVYPCYKDYKNGRQFHIAEVIDDIRTNSEHRNFTNKKELPVAYFSASVIVGRKFNKNVKEHSGLIVIDIDKDKNPNVDLLQLKKDLQNDNHTYACFNSPSGGIKVIVNTNIRSVLSHNTYFQSIKKYLLANYNITEVDPSGCNIARACYLPYDNNIFFNISANRFCLDNDQIEVINATLQQNKQLNNESKSLLHIDQISYDDHYNNILNLLKKRTEIGLYDNVFNDYRYYNIGRGVMDTSVPFLELIILKNLYPYQLDWETRLDEHYFRSNPQKQINVVSIGCDGGLEICKIGFRKGYTIKEHFRAKTLGSISMKLIFNNPFCHPDYLIKEVQRINNYFCEDPNPSSNPKPNDEEVRNIVMLNYSRFLEGELDFSKVVRMNPKKNTVAPKYVFKSKEYLSIDRSITHLEAVRIFHDGKNTKKQKLFEKAIYELQDGSKITHKRIAKLIGVSTRTVRRYMKEKKYSDLADNYNFSVMMLKNRSKMS